MTNYDESAFEQSLSMKCLFRRDDRVTNFQQFEHAQCNDTLFIWTGLHLYLSEIFMYSFNSPTSDKTGKL